MMINIGFTAKEYRTQKLVFSFNNHDFFQTDVFLTFMPDLILSELSPRTAILYKSVEAKLYV